MKKHFSIFAALVAAMAAVSCVQEEAPVTIPQEENNNPAIFTASFSEDATKATLNDDYSVAWEDADQVGIFAAAATPHLYVAELMDEAGAKASLATEEVVGAAETFYAIYPYDADATIADGVISTELPEVQTAVKDDFAHHLAVSKTSDYTFNFKNVCGLVKVTVNTSDVVSVVLQGLNNEVVAGGVKISVSNEPSWVADGSNGSKTVTLKAEGDGVLAKGTYYFAVLPQTFENGFTVTSNKKNGEPVVRTVSSKVTVKRAKIVTGNANGIAGKGTEAEPYIIMTAQDMCDMRGLASLGEETWFKLGADIDMKDVKKWTPVNFDGDFERKIHFEGAKVANPKTKDDCYSIINFAPDSFIADDQTTAANYPSIFGVLYGTCKNVNIVNASVSGTVVTGIVGGYVGTVGKLAECVNVHVQGTVKQTKSDRTGGFAGAGRNATLTNCTVDVVITSLRPDVGGFFGRTYDDVKMTGCTAVVDIESSTTESDSWRSRVGGLVGYVSGNSAKITDCHSSGIIKDFTQVSSSHTAAMGGLVGHLSAKENLVSDSSSSVDIETEWGASVGGAIGINGAGTLGVENITTTGNISGSTNLGGLIGLVEYGVTKVSITGCNSTSTVIGTGHYCGGLVGWIQSKGDGDAQTVCDIELTDCHAEGDVTSTGSSVAGLVGAVANVNDKNPVVAADFTDCSASGDITGSNNVGGIIGNLGAGGNFIGCQYEGDIIGAKSVGGLVGNFNTGGIVRNCHSSGTLTSTLTSGDVQIGGLVGNGYPNAFESCSAECDIDYKGIYAGGIVGYQRGPVAIDKCSFEGTISRGTRHAGGIVGRSNGVTTIQNCSASTSLGVSDTWTGGIIAYAAYDVTIKNSYSNCTVTGGKCAGGIMGQCTMKATFVSCIAWGTASATNATSGAIVGAAGEGSTTSNCYYNSAFTPATGATGLHGTAAPEGSTISSLASTLGWNTAIWDLSGHTPKLM